MEHFLQFAISIDDDAIVKRIEENAEKNITEELKKKVMKLLFDVNPWSSRQLDVPTEWTKTRIEDFLNDHKDEIVQCAGNILAEKLLRTKAVKETVGRLTEDQS